MSGLTIPHDYGYVIASVGVFSITQFFAGGLVGAARRKVYKNNDALWKKKEVIAYAEAHKKAMGDEIDKNGYPDMGNGPISQQLDYADWLSINNAQRAHYKYIEESAPFLASVVTAGLVFPRTSAILCLTNVVARIVWGRAYTKYGSSKRYSSGGMLAPLSTIAMLFVATYAGLKSVGQPAGFISTVRGLLGV